jgi:perosamine synthetase
MAHLAVRGGEPVRRRLFPAHNTVGAEEREAVGRVIDSGVLSGFYGSYDIGFRGGPQVRALEQEWAHHFGVRHAVAVNSATSGLMAAVGAAGLGPGDEAIVTPMTMSATATALVIWGVVPVFADVEPEHFCLDPEAVERAITPRTRAIVVTDLFGQPYDAPAINAIAERHGLQVIEDAAQAPNARLGERYAGTLGHLGIHSLNYHKHIHSGEGGLVCTDDDRLADRLRMIRNHAEAVAGERIADEPDLDLANMVGFNFRMTELEAAIAREQLRKLPGLVAERLRNVRGLEERLAGLPCLRPAPVRAGAQHVYYSHPWLYERSAAGLSRERFIGAVAAELPASELREDDGPLLYAGYGQPLYRLPMYRRRLALGAGGAPFAGSTVSYADGICPVAERVCDETLVLNELMRPGMGSEDLDDVAEAFWKVWRHREELA